MAKTTLGQRIKQARLAKKLTQTELAKKIGSDSHTRISDLERGKRGKRPDVEVFAKIAHELGISLEWLLLGKETNNK